MPFSTSIRPGKIPKVKFPKDVPVPDSDFQWLNEKQQSGVFEFLKDEPIFEFLRWTGTRQNEGRGLLWDNVDLAKKKIVLKTVLDEDGKEIRNRTKTGKLRILPIIPELEKILDPAKKVSEFVFTNRGKPYSSQTLRHHWNKANRLAIKNMQRPLSMPMLVPNIVLGLNGLSKALDLKKSLPLWGTLIPEALNYMQSIRLKPLEK